MDLFLEENAPEMLELVKNACNSYGEDKPEYAYDVERDPIYCIYGYPSQNFVDREVAAHKAETEKVLEFVNMWACDINELELNTDEDKFIFALQYLAGDYVQEMIDAAEDADSDNEAA